MATFHHVCFGLLILLVLTLSVEGRRLQSVEASIGVEPNILPLVHKGGKGGDDDDDDDDKDEGKGKGKGKGGYERRKKRKKHKNKKKEKKCKKTGKKHPKYQYHDCSPTISPAPSRTEYPSWSPTDTPVPTDTAFPSIQLTWTPTVTAVPSPSPLQGPVNPPTPPPTPSPTPLTTSLSTPAPTPLPTASPTSVASSQPTSMPSTFADAQKADACAAIDNGTFIQTDASIGVRYFYELLTYSSGVDIVTVAANAEEIIRSYLASQMVVCSTSNRRRLETLGVGPGLPDQIAPAGSCFNLDDSSPETTCYYMEGSLVLYLSQDSSVSTTSGPNQVFELLKTALNGERRKLQEGFLDIPGGVLGLYFRGGTIGDGTGTTSGDVPSSAEENSVTSIGSSISATGIALIVVAAVGVVVVGFFAFRRRKQQETIKERELMEIDDGTVDTPKNTLSLDEKVTDRVSPAQAVNILGDETDSIFTGLDFDTLHLHHEGRSIFVSPASPIFVPAEGAEVYTPSSAYATRKYAVGDTVDL